MTEGPHQSRAHSEPLSGEPDTSRGDPELIGRMVSGKYKIELFLGGGAMGAVYKARFAALEKYVAVKVMHRAIAVDPNFVGRFHREAKAASRLDHPNSMRVIDFGEEPDGLLYIAMEYVEGRDLYRVIHEDWPISNADIGDILMQALAAIAVAHEMGVIHRDLKPENLMILRAKNDEERDAYLVKVCDFGIAKITEKDDEPKPAGGPGGQKLTTQGLVVGTPEYMSPEQAKGEKLDPRSDIYSMGVILYQLLTGRTPFTGDTPLAVVLKHITENPQAPSVHYAGVHKGLEAVCLRAMAKEREGRWQTARAMRNAIREALEGRPMPVDAADTLAIGGSAGPTAGTNPLGLAGVNGPMVVAQGVTAPGAPIDSAPTVAGGITASHMTPLGTAAAAVPANKSRAGLVIGLGAVAALCVAGVFVAPRLLARHPHDRDRSQVEAVPPSTNAVPTSTAMPATPTAPTAVTVNTTEPPPTTAPAEVKTGKANATPPTGRAPGTSKAGNEPPPPNVATAVAPPPVAPPPPPPVTAVVPPPPPVAPAPPPAPVFNPGTCRASPGQVHGSGSTNSRDLNLNSAAAVWTSCAQRSIREKPGGPIAASVHLRFSDNKAFRGASCTGCPPALAQCIASSTTGGTVSVTFRGGDVTGEPAFDVPVNITCE